MNDSKLLFFLSLAWATHDAPRIYTNLRYWRGARHCFCLYLDLIYAIADIPNDGKWRG
jgi:hypothetical protein